MSHLSGLRSPAVPPVWSEESHCPVSHLSGLRSPTVPCLARSWTEHQLELETLALRLPRDSSAPGQPLITFMPRPDYQGDVMFAITATVGGTTTKAQLTLTVRPGHHNTQHYIHPMTYGQISINLRTTPTLTVIKLIQTSSNRNWFPNRRRIVSKTYVFIFMVLNV